MGTDSSQPRHGSGRNVWALLATYAYIAIVVLLALWYFRFREGRFPWWTDIPVGMLAVALIGPAQHRLLLLGQEAALGILFRNRWLNELVGDWLIHFPFSSATHHVRQQILSHYDYPNDPERDAERVMAARAGFWPLRYGRFLRLSALIRWNSLRANYNFQPNQGNPYYDPARPPSRVALHIGTVYVLLTFALLLTLYFRREELGDYFVETALTYVLPLMWLLAILIFWLLPDSKFHQGTLQGVYSPKTMTLMRITFVSLVNAGLGWITFTTERSAVLNYIALWIGPMFSVTPALYLIRHWRQHGELPPGEIARGCQPRTIGKWLLFPFRQQRHVEKHAEPRRPWFDLPS